MAKRQDQRYEIKVRVSQPGEKRRYKSVYGNTLREAKAKAKDLEAQVEAGITDLSQRTVEQVCEDWLAVKTASTSKSTRYQYRQHLARVTSLIGTMPARSVTIDTARDTIATIASQSVTVANMIRNRMSNVWEDAAARGIVTGNPWKGAQQYSHRKRNRRALTPEERTALETADLTPMDRAWVDLLLYTGIRRAESCGLRTTDVDFAQHRIHVVSTIVLGEEQGTKTDAGNRYIPMPKRLEKTLRDYIDHYVQDGDYLLTTTRGGHWGTTTVRNHWRDIMDRAFHGNPPSDLTPHVLRHNYASELVKHKVPPAVAQRLLGHANFAVTMDIYTHFGWSDIDADAIADIFD